MEVIVRNLDLKTIFPIFSLLVMTGNVKVLKCTKHNGQKIFNYALKGVLHVCL